MLITAYSFFMLTGAVGFLSCFIFVRAIYGAVKVGHRLGPLTRLFRPMPAVVDARSARCRRTASSAFRWNEGCSAFLGGCGARLLERRGL